MTDREVHTSRLLHEANAEVARLRALAESLAARIAAQSDALARTAEGRAALLLDTLRPALERIASGDYCQYEYDPRQTAEEIAREALRALDPEEPTR